MTDTIKPIDTALMDPTVPAAVDFYRRANGGWLAANPVPPAYGAWGAFHEVNERNLAMLRRLLADAADSGGSATGPRRIVGDYVAAGMDEAAIAAAGVEPLRPLLDEVDAVATIGDLRAAAGDLQRHGIGALYSFAVAADFEDSDAYLAYVGQGGLGLPERDYYLRDDERSDGLRRAYVDHVAAQLHNLGSGPDAAGRDAAAILAFETRLAQASLPVEQLRDPKVTMNRHAVRALDALMPGFGLAAAVRELGVPSPTVNIDNAAFFDALDAALTETPIETLRAYLRWHVVRTCASSLPPAFEDEAFAFHGRILGGRKEMHPRWRRVLDAAGSDIGDLVARLYVDAAFPPQAKARCEELVGHLLNAMGRAIRGAAWMTEPTRTEALAKLAGFGCKIGYPDRWRDYTGIAIDRGSFAGNRLAASAFEHQRVVGRMAEPVDRGEWEMPAHSVNAYYHPLLNEIVFPAGILQPPFFFAEADDAVDYGAIGTVIGHEITHGFDDQGSRFDAAGKLRDWWTAEDRSEFERRARVVVEQFNGFTVADDSHVNGQLTLGENIADLGGLEIAFDALREAGGLDGPRIDGFTPAQRFFLAFGSTWRMSYTEETARLLVSVDPHAPAHDRVNGPLANLPSFAAAFDVPDGSPMAHPAAVRAKIW